MRGFPGRAAVGAVALAALVALSACSGPDPAPPPPAPPVTVTVTVPAPAPTPAAPGTTAPETAPSVRPPVRAPLVVPGGVLLPDENRRAESPEFTDWTTDNRRDQAWLLDPCQPTAYPTDAQRVGFRTVSRTGPEAHDARQLATYPSDAVAAEAVAGFRRALAACATGTTATGLRWTWVAQDAPGLGDGGLLAASVFGDESPTGDRIALARAGSAVFLAYLGGEYRSAELDQGARDAEAVVQRFLDSL
jgi:type IV secretory pathway VirB10-like protein